MNKKSSIIYVMMIFIVIIVAFGFFSLICYKIIDEVKSPILEDINITEAVTLLNDTHSR